MTVSSLARNASQTLRLAMKGTGYALMFFALATVAKADTPIPGPEIDPGSAVSALTLFVGSIFLLTDKVRRK